MCSLNETAPTATAPLTTHRLKSNIVSSLNTISSRGDPVVLEELTLVSIGSGNLSVIIREQEYRPLFIQYPYS